jgi:hypothetical protein
MFSGKYIRQKCILIVLVSLFYLILFSFNVFALDSMPSDGIYLIRPIESQLSTVDFKPEYITDEQLFFYSCIEGVDTAFSSLICDDTSDLVELPTYPWLWDGCFISYYDFNNTACNEFTIQTEYVYKDEILKIDDKVVLKDVQSIPYPVLNSVDSDGGWGDPVSTAYAISVFATFNRANFENTYQEQIESGLTWLKENRDETEKCWPEDECDIKTTALILSYLTRAGLEDSSVWYRILHDGKVWLQKNQNLFNTINPSENDEATKNWTMEFGGADGIVGGVDLGVNTSCLLSYDDDIDMVLQVEPNTYRNVSFYPIHGSDFDFACTPEDLNIEIFDDLKRSIFNTSSTNLSYTVPYSCWDDQEKWFGCDVETTLYASMVDLNSSRLDLAKNWLTSILIEDDDGIHFNTSKNISDTSLFLYGRMAADEDDDINTESGVYPETDFEKKIIRWLLYNQNNDGSWGDVDDEDSAIIDTALVTLSLEILNNKTYAESISDSNHWISLNTPSGGWDDVERDSLSFLVFSQSAKPFIRSEPALIIVDSVSYPVQLYNPSSFDFLNMEFSLEGEIKDYLDIDPIGSLLSDYYKEIKLVEKKKVDSTKNGYLIIEDNGNEISKIPVIIKSVPTLNITSSSKTFIYDGLGKVIFNIRKSAEKLNCELNWDDSKVKSKTQFALGSETKLSVDLNVGEIRNQEKTYTGKFVCSYEDGSLSIPVSISTQQFDSEPFSIAPDFLNVTSIDGVPVITIYNNVNVPITIQVEFLREDAYFMIDSPLVDISPLSSESVMLSNFLTQNDTVEYSNVIVVSGYGLEKDVDFYVDIKAKTSRKSLLNFLTFFVFFGIFGGGTFYLYKTNKLPKSLALKLNLNQHKMSASNNKNSSKKTNDDVSDELNNGKDLVHLAELIKIMLGLGQDDDDIANRLKMEGFPEYQVKEVMDTVKQEMDNESALEKEERFMRMMKTLELDVGATRSKLKQEGFTDKEIQEAFKESEDEITKKEKDLKKKIDDQEKFNVKESDSEKSKSKDEESKK